MKVWSATHRLSLVVSRLHQLSRTTQGRWALRAALAGVSVVGLLGLAARTGDLHAAFKRVTHLSAWWVAAAVSAEAVVYLAYSLGLRRLVGQAETRPRYRHLVAVSVASQGVASLLPATNAVIPLLAYRLLRRVGLTSNHAAKVVAVSTLLFNAALILLALISASIVGGATQVNGLRLAALGVLGALSAAGTVMAVRSRAIRRAGDTLTRRLTRRLFQAVQVHLEPAHPIKAGIGHWRQWAPATGWFAMAWIADAACLTLSFYALHARPSWPGLPLAYLAGQLATLVPFTPGGLGVVEGGLAAALTVFGTPAPTSLAVVLIYRLISFWGLLPAGGIAYIALRRRRSTAPPGSDPDASLLLSDSWPLENLGRRSRQS